MSNSTVGICTESTRVQKMEEITSDYKGKRKESGKASKDRGTQDEFLEKNVS